MTIITRVSRLFQADIHAVLDRMEEPEVLLRQAVREMEEDLASDERRLRILDQEHKRLDDRLSDLDQTLNGIEEQLDLCFESGKEDLARSLVRRKLENRQFRKHLAAQRKTMEQSRNDLSARLDENRTRLESVRQKAEVLSVENTPSQAGNRRDITMECTVREEDVDIAFLREQQKRRHQ